MTDQTSGNPNEEYIPKPYVIDLNSQSQSIESNRISTSKYTWFNCIPKILLEQFSKMANVYFLIIAVMQSIPEISISGGKPVILFPLSIVIFINGLKDFLEDWKRKVSDDEENHRLTLIFNKEKGIFEEKRWENIKLGDIVKIREKEYFPADIFLINSQKKKDTTVEDDDEEIGICFIETKNLDGETNLKFKQAIKEIAMYYKKEEDLKKFSGKLVCNQPSEYINNFDGKFFTGIDETSWLNMDKNNLLLRGCSLRQTYCVYGVAVYIGHNTKIMKNSPNARSKISRVEAIMNFQIIIIFIVDIVLSLIGAASYMVYLTSKVNSLKYIDLGSYSITALFFFSRVGTWILIFTNLVPISLLVTMEMIKYIQGIFISWDIKIYDEKTFTPAKVQTSTLNEELGQVKFIFSDKTGTLTKNYMEFKMMSIGKYSYGEKIEEAILEDKHGKITNFNLNDPVFREHLSDPNHENHKNIHNYLLCLALCNTVFTEDNTESKVVYSASSPDEMALINASRYYKYIFLRREVGNKIIIEINESRYEYQVSHILEYSSERKRMSVIALCPDGVVRMFTKGADMVIKPRISQNVDLVPITDQHLLDYARKGLRTLMIAYKDMSKEEFISFDSEYSKALDREDKNKALMNIFDKYENGLYLLGVTAIEDQLQDHVGDCLEAFILTGIRVWVLTGDKIDTAKSIAYSCRLITHEFLLFEFQEQSSLQTLSEQIFSYIQQARNDRTKKYALIISSEELTLVTNTDLVEMFYELSLLCNAVLCCRVSPKQKAEMVNLIKTRQPLITTLAIGDGANDVNMITAAHIGIGILGVEGRQAARASDYSIAQFSFLKRLMFVHGRESYRKNTYVICYNFYKNVLFVMPQFWFGFFSIFSGQTLYDPWIYQLYNLIFTCLPCIWFGIYDKEYSYHILEKETVLYVQGMEGKLFHSLRFWKWVIYGFVQGLVLCLICFLGNETATNNFGNIEDLWSVGSIIYAAIVMIVNIKIMTSTNTHTFISIGLALASIFSYFAVLGIMSNYRRFENFNDAYINFTSPFYYFSLIGAVCICLLVDIGLRYIFVLFGVIDDASLLRKNDDIKLIEKEKIRREKTLHEESHEKNNQYHGSAFAQDQGQTPFITRKTTKIY